MSWAALSWTRIKVQSAACAAANPITRSSPLLRLRAPATSHAASRRIRSLWREREAAGKNEADVMAICVACFGEKWNQLAMNTGRPRLHADRQLRTEHRWN